MENKNRKEEAKNKLIDAFEDYIVINKDSVIQDSYEASLTERNNGIINIVDVKIQLTVLAESVDDWRFILNKRSRELEIKLQRDKK